MVSDCLWNSGQILNVRLHEVALICLAFSVSNVNLSLLNRETFEAMNKLNNNSVFLASPCMGDIQLSFYDRKGVFEVEVIRARGLLPKPGSKILPGKTSGGLSLYILETSVLNSKLVLLPMLSSIGACKFCIDLFFIVVFFILTAPYVKVYLMENGKCLAKKKTRTARRTLEPLYQQQLEFRCDVSNKTLQVRGLIFSLTMSLCSEFEWGSTSTVLMFML